MPQEPEKRYFEFGPYRLDPATGVLTRNGQLVLLNPKAAKTLAVLVGQQGRVVSKDELMKAVWRDAFVEEANLNVQISALRKALEDSAENPLFIETIPRRGYRFRSEVQEVQEEQAAPPVHRRAAVNGNKAPLHPAGGAAVAEAAPAFPATRRFGGRTLALSAMLVMAAVLAINFWPRPGQPVKGAPSGRFLIGVLPFANLSGDSGQEYLSDGLTDEVITEMARLNPRELGVIARASMMPYKGSAKGIGQIAQELGLRYALEGSVLRSGDRVRINVKLIQASDQSQVWANEYDRDFKDILEVQREVARSVARETFVHLAPETDQRRARARTVSPQAYDAYLKGRFYLWMRAQPYYDMARVQFEQALRIDPNFALAHAGLADVYAVWSRQDPRIPARRAVELDDNLAEGHTSLAFALWGTEINWTASEAHFRRALEIDPYYTPARHWYAYLLANWGRHAEAIEQIERAKEVDPLNVVILADMGQIYYWAGQYERAKAVLNRALSVDPKFQWTHYWLGRVFEAQGNFNLALTEYEQALDQPFSRMDKNTAMACLFVKMGHPEKTRAILRRLEKDPDFLPRNRAMIYTALGEKSRALEILNDTVTPRYPSTALGAAIDPNFASLRSDPRFQQAIAKIAPPTR